MKRKKKLIIATLVVAGLIIGGSTFAWFTSEDSVVNTLKTGTFKTTVTETFAPPTNWQPGQKVTKEAAVTNVGSTDALVKVKLTQELILKTETTDVTDEPKTVTTDFLTNLVGEYTSEGNVTDTNTSRTVAVYQKNRGGGVYEIYAYYTDNNQEAEVTVPDSYTGNVSTLTFKPVYLLEGTPTTQVYAPLVDSNFVLNFASNVALSADKIDDNTVWIYNENDHYFYYIGVVAAGETTPDLLSSVELLSTADNKYQNAEFNLTVEQQGIQAFTDDTDGSGAIAEFVGSGSNTTIEGTIESKLAALTEIHTEGETYAGETATVTENYTTTTTETTTQAQNP